MTQPPVGPPQGPPWGGYPPAPPTPPGPPPRPGRGGIVAAGAVLGGIATVMLPLMSLGVADATGLGALVVALLIVPITGLGLLFSDVTRPWGIGVLIGWAVVLIVLGGACVAILSSLE